jgi:hypothetical protein
MKCMRTIAVKSSEGTEQCTIQVIEGEISNEWQGQHHDGRINELVNYLLVFRIAG